MRISESIIHLTLSCDRNMGNNTVLVTQPVHSPSSDPIHESIIYRIMGNRKTNVAYLLRSLNSDRFFDLRSKGGNFKVKARVTSPQTVHLHTFTLQVPFNYAKNRHVENGRDKLFFFFFKFFPPIFK